MGLSLTLLDVLPTPFRGLWCDRGTPAILATRAITGNGYSAALPCTGGCPMRQSDSAARPTRTCPGRVPLTLYRPMPRAAA